MTETYKLESDQVEKLLENFDVVFQSVTINGQQTQFMTMTSLEHYITSEIDCLQLQFPMTVDVNEDGGGELSWVMNPEVTYPEFTSAAMYVRKGLVDVITPATVDQVEAYISSIKELYADKTEFLEIPEF